MCNFNGKPPMEFQFITIFECHKFYFKPTQSRCVNNLIKTLLNNCDTYNHHQKKNERKINNTKSSHHFAVVNYLFIVFCCIYTDKWKSDCGLMVMIFGNDSRAMYVCFFVWERFNNCFRWSRVEQHSFHSHIDDEF